MRPSKRRRCRPGRKLIHDYLRGRSSLARVYLLIDARHGIKPVDEVVLETLDKAAVSYQIVLTKADELKPGGIEERMAETAAKHRQARRSLSRDHPHVEPDRHRHRRTARLASPGCSASGAPDEPCRSCARARSAPCRAFSASRLSAGGRPCTGSGSLQTAAQFLLFHAPALLGLRGPDAGGAVNPQAWRGSPATCWCSGLVLFCGDLSRRALAGVPLCADGGAYRRHPPDDRLGAGRDRGLRSPRA